MTNAQKLTLEVIRYELSGVPVDNMLVEQIDDNLLEEMLGVAADHDIGYMVGSGLHKLNLLSNELQSAFFSEQLASIYRYERIKYETDCIIELFEREKIEFILLKGSVIRELYPKPEMRMSCDLDILVHQSDIEKAGELLQKNLSFSYDSKSTHDIQWISKTGLKLELHFTLMERNYAQKELLDKVWSYAMPVRDGSSQYVLTNEYFVFYHISHIAKHMLNGGCGIRHFLDLWFINERLEYNKDILYQLLEKSKLVAFADVAFDISKVWFSEGIAIELPENIDDYILNGGSFGSLVNSIALEKEKTGNSKLNILLKRIFASKKTLGNLYPAAEKYPVFLPYFAVARWCRIIFKDRMKEQAKMIKTIATVSNDEQDRITDLMKKIGLSDQNEQS